MSDITPAREALEVAICGALGKAWQMPLACLAADITGRGVPLEYPEIRAEAEKVLAAAEAWGADEVAKVADVTLGRARAAEDELAALEGRLAQVITAAVEAGARAEAAEAKLAGARELAEAWAGGDGQGPPTPETLTEAACGKALLDLLAGEEAPRA